MDHTAPRVASSVLGGFGVALSATGIVRLIGAGSLQRDGQASFKELVGLLASTVGAGLLSGLIVGASAAPHGCGLHLAS
jgi:hypothetical protein